MDKTIRFYNNRRKALFFIGLSVFLLCSETYMMISKGFRTEWIVGLIMFLIMLVYSVYLYVETKPAITLSFYGVTARSWRGRQIAWDNISYVEVRRSRRQYSVLVHTENGFAAQPGNKVYRIYTNMIRVSPYELCELMQVLSIVPGDERAAAFDAILSGVNLTVIRNKFIPANYFN